MDWKRILLAAGAVILLVLLGVGLWLNSLLGPGSAERLAGALQAKLQVPVEVGGLEFSLGRLVLLSPTASISGLKVGNPEGFQSRYLLEADNIQAQIRLMPLLDDRLEIPRLTILAPTVRLERDRSGRSNLQALLAQASSDGEGASPLGEPGKVSIELLRLESGRLHFAGGSGGSGRTIEAIDLQLSDFSPSQASRLLLTARLLGGDRSKLIFEGQSGPFDEGRMPARGELSLELALSEIDPDVRRNLLGNVLGQPGENSLVQLEASLEGDVSRSLHGEGRLAFSDLFIGKNRRRRLPLAGELPLHLHADNLLAQPRVKLDVDDGNCLLGKGRWSGQAEFQASGEGLRGISRGRIQGVDVNEVLSAFTQSEDDVFGTLRMPAYSLRFHGSNAEKISQSLEGEGQFLVEKGRVAAFDMLDRIRKALPGAPARQAEQDEETEFRRLTGSFRIRRGKIHTPDLQLTGPALEIQAQGALGFNRSLDYQAQVRIEGGLQSLLGPQGAALGDFLPQGAIPVRIGGTFDRPVIRPDLQASTRSTLQGLLEDLLKKDDEPPEGDQ